MLYHTSRIKNKYFAVYYNSCNLDYVLYLERNLRKAEKTKKARAFLIQYDGKSKEFIELLDKDLLPQEYKSYAKSWNLLKKVRNLCKDTPI